MRIFFWNVQRLGAATKAVRQGAISNLAKAAAADVQLYCEVLGGSDDALIWSNRRATTRGLGYRCATTFGGLPDEFTPMKTDRYAKLGFKGGNSFKLLANRKPGQLHLPDGVYLYFIHAPATAGKAKKAVAFLLCDLIERHEAAGEKFILVGDLNVIPPVLKTLEPYGLPVGNYIRRSGSPTHHSSRAPRGGGRELDYALSNIDAGKMTVTRRAAPRRYSDHDAIVVNYKL